MSHEKYKNIGSPLTKAVEECAEFIHIACKLDRFGWNNFHPDDQAKTTNKELLKREMDDVVNAFCELEKYISNEEYNKSLHQMRSHEAL